jgi:hypothetical protein
MFEGFCVNVPPERLVLAGTVLAILHLIHVVGSALLAWVQSKARVAEIDASSRAEVAQIQETGKVLLALAKIAGRHGATRSGSLEGSCSPCPQAGIPPGGQVLRRHQGDR